MSESLHTYIHTVRIPGIPCLNKVTLTSLFFLQISRPRQSPRQSSLRSRLFIIVYLISWPSSETLQSCLTRALQKVADPCSRRLVLSCLFLFLFFLCRWLRYVGLLSSRCSPSFAAVALPCAAFGFPVSLACSVLLPYSLGISFVVFMFLPPLLTCWAPLHGVPVSVFTCQLLQRYFCRRSLSCLALGFALWLRM